MRHITSQISRKTEQKNEPDVMKLEVEHRGPKHIILTEVKNLPNDEQRRIDVSIQHFNLKHYFIIFSESTVGSSRAGVVIAEVKWDLEVAPITNTYLAQLPPHSRLIYKNGKLRFEQEMICGSLSSFIQKDPVIRDRERISATTGVRERFTRRLSAQRGAQSHPRPIFCEFHSTCLRKLPKKELNSYTGHGDTMTLS
ncbi:hypothetical protein JR316_0000059 [Psilocybe cubensis]|uniref:Uncharacterized protein n=2 Tax=Psilocybe cubensis TaxID=181762 RepID=A0ACB8HEU5_PSICU|nr:hypothetical protein JR316_0000059 [Psilocybe cubensis]KAH9485996.1 hypothetical protein JR316_0000059 [Psilocybe cubensis]